jgi:hypothetical protein
MFIFPPSDGRTIILSRYTQPEADLQLLLKQLLQSGPNLRSHLGAQACQLLLESDHTLRLDGERAYR